MHRNGIFKIPSSEKPNAGLDLRKSLIINDKKYFSVARNPRIPKVQVRRIKLGINKLESQLEKYVSGYKKHWKKDRIEKEALYKYSTLRNYHHELGLDPLKAKEKSQIKEMQMNR